MADAENPDYEDWSPENNPEPPIPVSDPHNQSGLRKARSQHSKKEKEPTERRIREWMQFSVNLILAVVGIIAICIYYGQLQVMKGQLGEIVKQFPEIQKQATAAQGQLTQAREDSSSAADATADQLKVFQGQLSEARSTRELTESQWKAQQRPWIGLSGNVEFPKPPTFEVFAVNTPGHSGIDLNVNFSVKNFGISPAFKTASKVEVTLRDNTLALPRLEMKGACSLAEMSSRSEGSDAFGNSVIFPTGGTSFTSEIVANQPIELTKIRRVWIVGCIAYQDGVSNVVHHTEFWIMSYMIPENASPTLIEQGKIVSRFSLPISGWEMVKTEAD